MEKAVEAEDRLDRLERLIEEDRRNLAESKLQLKEYERIVKE